MVKISIGVLLGLLVVGGLARLGLVRTPVGDTETTLSDLRSLYTALLLYYSRYDAYPRTLAALGPPLRGAAPNANGAGLVDAELASGIKRGYRFGYRAFSSSGGTILDKFTINADPIPIPGKSEKSAHYFVDEDLVIHIDPNSVATSLSPPIN